MSVGTANSAIGPDEGPDHIAMREIKALSGSAANETAKPQHPADQPHTGCSRHLAGGMPNSRLNARLKASSDS